MALLMVVAIGCSKGEDFYSLDSNLDLLSGDDSSGDSSSKPKDGEDSKRADDGRDHEDDCDGDHDDDGDRDDDDKKIEGVKICHIPPGNPAKKHTISVGKFAASVHIALHGDYKGECKP